VDKDGGNLSVSNSSLFPNPTFSLNPLVAPYWFLFDQSANISWPTVRNEAVWQARLKNAVYEGQKTEGDRTYSVLRVPGAANPNSVFKVMFAPTVEYYPLAWELSVKDSPGVAHLKVDSYKVVQSWGENVVVPLKSEMVSGEGEPESARIRFTIEEASLKINPELDDDLFTYPQSQVEWVHDVDAKTHLPVGGQKAAKKHLGPPISDAAPIPVSAPRRLWGAAVVVALSAVVIVAFWRLRRRSV
jgi:hypothetical protein